MNGEDFISGKLILIDKEKKWSSFDVVNKIRNAIKNGTFDEFYNQYINIL